MIHSDDFGGTIAASVSNFGSSGAFASAARVSRATKRMNYLNTDRPDIAFAVKELARKICKPNAEDEQRVKRLAGT